MSRAIAALPLLKQGKRWYVVLITSRGNGAWIIPKGQPEKNHSDREVAAVEAFEEAGVLGKVRPRKIATQCRPTGTEQVNIIVYPLLVEAILNSWPEKRSGDANSSRSIKPSANLLQSVYNAPSASSRKILRIKNKIILGRKKVGFSVKVT